MANTNKPRGFIPFTFGGKLLRTTTYTKTAAQVLYEGDLIKRVGAGTVEVCGAGVTAGIVGVCARYSPASETTVEIYDDPDVVYQAQCDGTTAFAEADIGQNVDVAAGSPDTALNRSGMLIDMATKAATATLPFKILGLAAGINGDPNTAAVNALLLVKINATEGHAGATGV